MENVRHKVLLPNKEPISIEEARAHLRLIPGDSIEESAIVEPLIQAAREYCENITGRAIAIQEIIAYPEEWKPVVRLPKPPVIRVIEVTVYRKDGMEQTLDPSAYVLDDLTGTLFFAQSPGELRSVRPIQIRYEAGYEKLPATIRQAMLLMIGHWYENREAVVVGSIASIEVQKTTSVLLNQYKVWWF